MPTLNQVRGRIDTLLASQVWPLVVDRQEEYYRQHGRFWQGLWSHVAIPEHADSYDDKAPDNLTSRPTDQLETWADRFAATLDAPIPMRLRMDTWDGPRGQGFVVTIQVRYRGEVYQRSQGARADVDARQIVLDDEGTEDWHQVELEAV